MSGEFTEASADRQAICGPRIGTLILIATFSKTRMRNATCYPISEAKLFPMKQFVAAILFAGTLAIISSTSAQAPAQKDEQTLLTLVKEVQAQQVEIAANQTKIDTKLADIAEAIRVARIYSSRGR